MVVSAAGEQKKKQCGRAGAQLSHEKYQRAANAAPLSERRLMLMSHLASCSGSVLQCPADSDRETL